MDRSNSRRLLQSTFQPKSETVIIDRIQEMGFEGYNPILNMGGVFILTFVYFLQLILAFCLKIGGKRYGYLDK